VPPRVMENSARVMLLRGNPPRELPLVQRLLDGPLRNVAARFAEYATPGEVKSTDDIAPGTGAVVRRGFRKIAAYRDESGMLHCRSAVCTHLRCIVHWNSDERTWDCPCHGSRFDKIDGRPLNGPAHEPLGPAES